MSNVKDVFESCNGENFIQVHEHGFVRLVDHMGSDDAICRAARMSYGTGTKSISDDRNLIRYLLRHKHTTPFEMGEIVFHIKLPIFVMRQLIRHRTASVNEYSGRYSVMSDEFYIPDSDHLQPQSTTNKQGRAGQLSKTQKNILIECLETIYKRCYGYYQTFIHDNTKGEFNEDNPPCFGLNVDSEFPGLTRELARLVLPVSNYTECYWKIDLHNLMNVLRLRLDPHAQKEIVEFAEAIYKLSLPLFPVAFEAFEDYIRQAKTLSRMEIDLLKIYMHPDGANIVDPECAGGFTATDALLEYGIRVLGMSKREVDEFKSFWFYYRN